MKKLLIAVALLSGFSHAAHIHNAVYDAVNDQLEMDITYGGCNLETFRLDYGPCLETYPAQTRATLNDKLDICRGFIRTKLRLSLNDMSCRPAHMAVYNSRSTTPVTTVFVTEKQNQNIVKAERFAQPVNVESVKVVIEGSETGFPMAHVYANVVFGNKCTVARPNELVRIVQHEDDFRTLVLAVGNESNRICTMEYRPTPVTLDLGVYSKPNDGMFDKIIVNGKVATSPF